MPPRFAYWTILIDNKPTAFRARDSAELLPTLHQLQRTNANVIMRWFARGQLWVSPDAERAAQRRPKQPVERRGKDWRPGGQHKDPRDRFKKRGKPGAPRPHSARPQQRNPTPTRANPRHGEQRRAFGAGGDKKTGPWRNAREKRRVWRPPAPTSQNPDQSAPPSKRRKRKDDEPPDRD
jgi:hypothetical protein